MLIESIVWIVLWFNTTTKIETISSPCRGNHYHGAKCLQWHPQTAQVPILEGHKNYEVFSSSIDAMQFADKFENSRIYESRLIYLK